MVGCKMVQCYRVPLLALVAVLLFEEGYCFETRENIGRPRRQLQCRFINQFRCADGTCIDDFNLCDGIVDCPDGTDETDVECKKINCGPLSFRCAYGACVNADLRCNGVKNCHDNSDESNCTTQASNTSISSAQPTKGSCLTPEYPANGKWVGLDSDQYTPGQEAPLLAILNYTCNGGYTLHPPKSLSVCINGKWSESKDCLKDCPSLKSTDRLIVQCNRDGGKVSCENPAWGTRATVNCRWLFENTLMNKNPYRNCYNSSWDYPLPICEPVCGLMSIKATRLRKRENISKRKYPWQVGIYRASEKDHICSGSIISPKVVLTAASCFETVDKEQYLLAAGKYYRNYEDAGDPDAQYSKIQELIVHEDYKGYVRFFAFDLAILVAQTAFQMTPDVLPICFDPITAFDFTSLINKKGVVTGWGFTSDYGNPSPVLKELEVEYKTKNTCTLPTDFKKYYIPNAPDKLCAGAPGEGKVVCKGDSGGGLMFFDDKTERYFIRGIVSIGPGKPSGGCDETHSTLYTSVQFHADLIQRILWQYKL